MSELNSWTDHIIGGACKKKRLEIAGRVCHLFLSARERGIKRGIEKIKKIGIRIVDAWSCIF